MSNKKTMPHAGRIILCLLGLAVLAAALPRAQAQAPAPVPASKTIYNVRDFGAAGNRQALDTPAINRAIDAAAQAGGGTVWVPAGTYQCGSIHLKSDINLHIDAGATILATTNSQAYDQPEPFTPPAWQDGGHTYFHNSLIWGEDLKNVSITGEGMIWGYGLSRMDFNQDRMDGYVNFGRPRAQWIDPATVPPGPPQVGNKAISLKNCRGVLIRDVTIFHGGHFAILTTGVDNMTIDNVTIDTNRDGMDLDCCRNVTVSNCRVNSPTDDAICPKSTYALGRKVITENMTITNCQVSGFREGTLLDGTMVPMRGNGRIKCGTEANGGFRNITISNCTFRSCKGLALEEVDGGIMENISVSNLTMMDVPIYAIYITTGRRNRGPAETMTSSTARNISISNVIATGIEPAGGIEIFGLPGLPVKGVRLENIRLVQRGGGTAQMAQRMPRELGNAYPEPSGTMPGYGVFARHVSGLELANINVGWEKEDQRPALYCVDVDGLEVDNFKAQLAPGVPGGKLEQVTGIVIRNSPQLLDLKAGI